MINYIKTSTPDIGIEEQSKKIASLLKEQKKVAWFICGGSNIGTAVSVMNKVRSEVPEPLLANLIVSQTDERYGKIGHKDSNWQQMIVAGFPFAGINFYPILRNESLEDTVVKFGKEVRDIFASVDVIVGLFGIGPDGHIAGILPHTPAVSDKSTTTGYVAEPFTRVSLSFPSLRKFNFAYTFAFGEAKREALINLKEKDLSLDEEPAQILKEIAEAYLYSDQV